MDGFSYQLYPIEMPECKPPISRLTPDIPHWHLNSAHQYLKENEG